MRIAQVSPLYESVPPSHYGGTERVVSFLTEELVRQGHEVTLFASGDSQTHARLISCAPEGLRLSPLPTAPLVRHVLQIERVARMASEFDVIHFHVDFAHFAVSRRSKYAALTTLHGRLDFPDLVALYEEFKETPVVSISNAQRAPLPMANWRGTVHHGLPAELIQFQPNRGEYLAFLGRISPEKRVDRAIEIARRAGMPIKIAAKVDPADRGYFDTQIKPLLGQSHVEFVGEITDAQKGAFLGSAACLLFPIDWPEPFGLVMIESMAAGTPVVAFRGGSVEEVIDEGQTGFICDDLEQAVAAVKRTPDLDRAHCRAIFDTRFTAARMAQDYVMLYETLTSPRAGGNDRAAPSRSLRHSHALTAAR